MFCNCLGRKGPGVQEPRLDGDGLGDDGEVRNARMAFLRSVSVRPKRLGLSRNWIGGAPLPW